MERVEQQETGERRRPESSLRTCVACGRKEAPGELARLVSTPERQIAVDWRRNLGGRGAHLCVRRQCVESAISGRRVGRVLKAELVYPTAEEFLAGMRTGLGRQLETLLRSARGARLVAAGTDAVVRELSQRKAQLVLLAEDGAGSERLRRLAAQQRVPWEHWSTKVEIGEALQRAPTAVVAILDRGLAAAAVRVLERLKALD